MMNTLVLPHTYILTRARGSATLEDFHAKKRQHNTPIRGEGGAGIPSFSTLTGKILHKKTESSYREAYMVREKKQLRYNLTSVCSTQRRLSSFYLSAPVSAAMESRRTKPPSRRRQGGPRPLPGFARKPLPRRRRPVQPPWRTGRGRTWASICCPSASMPRKRRRGGGGEEHDPVLLPTAQPQDAGKRSVCWLRHSPVVNCRK